MEHVIGLASYIESGMLQGMHRPMFSSVRPGRGWRTGSSAKGSFKVERQISKNHPSPQLLLIRVNYLIRWRASEDSSRNWHDTSAWVFSSTCGATMKVTTTFSCSRTRRGARTQKGLMCPSNRYVKGHSDEW
jgi:hypothetical protein